MTMWHTKHLCSHAHAHKYVMRNLTVICSDQRQTVSRLWSPLYEVANPEDFCDNCNGSESMRRTRYPDIYLSGGPRKVYKMTSDQYCVIHRGHFCVERLSVA